MPLGYRQIDTYKFEELELAEPYQGPKHTLNVAFGTDGDDTIVFTEPRGTAFAGDGNDTVIGSDDDDRLFGNAGKDRIEGNDGDDLIVGGAGTDLLFGGENDDTIYGDWQDAAGDGEARDGVFGGGGNDTLFGGGGDDVVSGDAGSDTISGGTGDDTLIGDSTFPVEHPDEQWVGEADTFVFSEHYWGDDTIVDFNDGLDLIDFSGQATAIAFADLTITQIGNDTEIAYTPPPGGFGAPLTNTITLLGISAGDIDGADFIF